MDEIKNPQDASQVEDTSGGDKESTSQKPVETFTKSQMEKATSDALAAAGRTAKTFEKREEAVTKAEERMAKLVREKDEAELKAAKDDPDLLSAIGERQRNRERKSELDKREQELGKIKDEVEDIKKEVELTTQERNAREIATRLNVDAESLIKFTDGSKEKMEELAKSLSKKGDIQPLKVDSSKTIGGEGMPDSAKGKIRAGWDELHK